MGYFEQEPSLGPHALDLEQDSCLRLTRTETCRAMVGILCVRKFAAPRQPDDVADVSVIVSPYRSLFFTPPLHLLTHGATPQCQLRSYYLWHRTIVLLRHHTAEEGELGGGVKGTFFSFSFFLPLICVTYLIETFLNSHRNWTTSYERTPMTFDRSTCVRTDSLGPRGIGFSWLCSAQLGEIHVCPTARGKVRIGKRRRSRDNSLRPCLNFSPPMMVLYEAERGPMIRNSPSGGRCTLLPVKSGAEWPCMEEIIGRIDGLGICYSVWRFFFPDIALLVEASHISHRQRGILGNFGWLV